MPHPSGSQGHYTPLTGQTRRPHNASQRCRGDGHPTRTTLLATRPETHQNLIHTDKEHTIQDRSRGRITNDASSLRSLAADGQHMHRTSNFSATNGTAEPQEKAHPSDGQTLRGIHLSSASQPIRCADRMDGGDRVRTDDPLLAKQVLSQLSYAPSGEAASSQRSALRRKQPCS